MDARLKGRLPRILAACAVMVAALLGAQFLLDGWLETPLLRLPALALLITAGGLSYGVAIFVTGATRMAELKGMLRRRRS
jgi:putative peptidoglycan lipid II flippase